MRFNYFVFILSAFILFLSFSCKKDDKDTRHILAVSVEPQRKILESIAGNLFKVVTVMPSGDNPETFEPSPLRRVEIEKSDIYFSLGLLPFEQTLSKSLGEKTKVVNVSEGINLIYDTHTHGEGSRAHTHRVADPHVWTSVINARRLAENMAESLIEHDPDNGPIYKENLSKYIARLDSLDKEFRKKISDSSAKSFLVWHPSLSYFARDYDLDQIAVSSDTKEMSVSSIASVIEKARNENAGIMFYQKEFDNRQAETISKNIGARLVRINPVEYDWENELSIIVDELTRQ